MRQPCLRRRRLRTELDTFVLVKAPTLKNENGVATNGGKGFWGPMSQQSPARKSCCDCTSVLVVSGATVIVLLADWWCLCVMEQIAWRSPETLITREFNSTGVKQNKRCLFNGQPSSASWAHAGLSYRPCDRAAPRASDLAVRADLAARVFGENSWPKQAELGTRALACLVRPGASH